MREWAKQEAPTVDVDAETAAFRDHEYRTAKTDWPAAWRTWMRRAAQWKPNGATVASTQPRPTRYEQLFGREEVEIVDGPSQRATQ